MQLPPALTLARYRCHKVVAAAQIVLIEHRPDNTAYLHLLGQEAFVLADREYMSKHNPQVGGYLVVYDDGYVSWSPQAAFEGGYTRLPAEGDEGDDATG